MNDGGNESLEEKWGDYLISWRSGLWISIREKESNVWKFVTFYAAAISLIIGLGQKLAATTDLAIDIAVAAAIVGLLTFWGLAIVIDSNSWMSRNLKLIGNVEKLFIPEKQYDNLIPQSYSSPFYRYFRPYTVNFFFLGFLGIIAFVNFLAHYGFAEQGWRPFLLPFLSFLYVLGFDRIQVLDQRARQDYAIFFVNSRGKSIDSKIETFPREYLEFKLALGAQFYKWASLASTITIVAYGVREANIAPLGWIKWVIPIVILTELAYWIVTGVFNSKLPETEKQSSGEDIMQQGLIGNWKIEGGRKFYLTFIAVCRWIIIISTILLIGKIYWYQFLSRVFPSAF